MAAESALHRYQAESASTMDWCGRRLLVSAGPTVERLDPARVLTNRSSGQMGVLIAQVARFRGADVDLVHGPLQLPSEWLEGLRCYPVESSQALQAKLQSLQSEADAVVMAAAVADWRRTGGAALHKQPKAELQATLASSLEPVPDLLAGLQAQRPSKQRILGFAALSGPDDQILDRAREKCIAKGCDLLMANPIDREGQGFGATQNGGWLLSAEGEVEVMPVTRKLPLAHALLDRLLQRLGSHQPTADRWASGGHVGWGLVEHGDEGFELEPGDVGPASAFLHGLEQVEEVLSVFREAGAESAVLDASVQGFDAA